MLVKNRDFIEIDYIAIDRESGKIFDLTSEEEAKKHRLYTPNTRYGPIVICVGEKQVIRGLDKFLEGKEVNKKYKLEIKPEDGFGKKDPKLMRLVPSSIFKKENIRPMPGLQINLDNLKGIIRTVSGGRVIVDFNHPLAGHSLSYEILINKIIKDDKTKVRSMLGILLQNPNFEVKDGILLIQSFIPDKFQKELKDKISQLVPTIKDVKFNTSLKK